MQSTLVLNAASSTIVGEPLSIVSAQRAITMVLAGKAFSVDNSPRAFHSARAELTIPYVIQLAKYVEPTSRSRSVFSRRGVLVRDKFTCVYCNAPANTIDHVIPQSKGGPTSYDNCVAACSPCNLRKDDNSLEFMGWTLDKMPNVPSWYLMALHKSPAGTKQRECWEQHILAYDPLVLA